MKKVILSALLLSTQFMFAQETMKPCGQSQETKKLWEQNPGAQEAFRNQVINLLKNSKVQNKSVYQIPIVFHIIHEYGAEDISDAQIYDEVANLNKNYNKLNADTTDVIPEFKPLIADVSIEFKLPAFDYAGNCTNGIERIYSHETNNGDDFSKIHQWDRNKYLNVWIVKTIGSGAAGYAFFPGDIYTGNSYIDGILILQDYVGSTGTSSYFHSKALTHEIGHYLGLPHVWGETNEPMVACGDDFVPDTPITKGFDFCPQNNTEASVCDPNIVENYQNYMDYSYCSRMFTLDQAALMIGCLNNPEAYRDMLVSAETAEFTGINLNPKPTCVPVAEFTSNLKTACINDDVDFTDESWNALVTSRTWTFQDGVPATATSANVTVNFQSSGWKRVSLVVGNATGSDSVIVDKYVYITPNTGTVVGPNWESFPQENPNYLVINPEDNFSKWQYTPSYGLYNTGGMYINNFFVLGNPPYSDEEYFYNNRIGGSKESLITPAMDLSTTGGAPTFSFDYAFATKTTVESQITESLIVYSSTNCGKTWIPRKTITGVNLLTAGNFTSEFLPDSDIYWKNVTFNIAGFINSGTDNVLFKFVFTASDYSNNFFIDNIRVQGELGMNENEADATVQVYPNPASQNSEVIVTFLTDESSVITLFDMNGKVISTRSVDATNAVENISLKTEELQQGCYLVDVQSNKRHITKKLIIE